MVFCLMVDVQVGDIVELRKGHPCGENRWRVYRIGADIGLRCLGCDRRQFLPRAKFNKAFKRKLEPENNTHDG
jgi:hypothetical protein